MSSNSGRLALRTTRRAPLRLASNGKTGCRPNDQRRADGEKEIAGAGKRFGAPLAASGIAWPNEIVAGF